MILEELKHVPVEDRAAFLENVAVEITNMPYNRPLSEEEIENVRFNLERDAIALSDKEAEFAALKAERTSEIKAVKTRIAEYVQSLRSRSETCTGNVYSIADQVGMRMYFVTPDGTIINQRPLLQHERQTNMFTLKSGTHGS